MNFDQENCLILFYVFRAKWYTVSVTEEEVHRGLLYTDNRNRKTFFYRRKIIDLEKHCQDKAAGKFIDKKVRRVWSIGNPYVGLLLENKKLFSLLNYFCIT